MTLRAPHPKKGNGAAEFRFACQLALLLQAHCSPTWRYTHLPFGELRAKATARKLQLMGVTAGWPDYMFVGPGKTCFLELKSFGGLPSKAQSETAGHIMACGCGYGMTSDLADAVSMLQAWGVLPAGIHVQ